MSQHKIEIPRGWYLVEQGCCSPRDQKYDEYRGHFIPVTRRDIGVSCEDFEFLIRRGNGVTRSEAQSC